MSAGKKSPSENGHSAPTESRTVAPYSPPFIPQSVQLSTGIQEQVNIVRQRELTKLCRMFMLDKDMFERN